MRFVFACLSRADPWIGPAGFFCSRRHSSRKSPRSKRISTAFISSDNRLWIVGYYGTILHSTDRGKTWEIQPSPTRSALFQCTFHQPRRKAGSAAATARFCRPATAARAGARSRLGTTEHLFALDWLDETHGWMAGSRGMTIRTNDGGRSWTNLDRAGGFHFQRRSHLSSATRGWIAGEFGVIFQTPDGGKSWVKQKSPVEVSFASGASQNLFALLFTAPTDGYAFGLDGLVLKTRDGIALGNRSPARKREQHKRNQPSVCRRGFQRPYFGRRRTRHAASIRSG